MSAEVTTSVVVTPRLSTASSRSGEVLQCVAVCCSELQCVAVWRSVVQYAAVCCIGFMFGLFVSVVTPMLSTAFSRSGEVLQRDAVRCSVLH